MLETFLSSLQSPIARIVHIGSGAAVNLPLMLDSGASAILIAEADGELAETLQQQSQAHAHVTVRKAAVSGDLQTRPFFRTSFPELNSLRTPTTIRELFPGMRILDEETITPLAPSILLEDPSTEVGTQALIVEFPGETLGILQAMHADDRLQEFDALCLREGHTPLYEGAPAISEIAAWLGETHYKILWEDIPEDAERPWLMARLDRNALQQQQALATLEADLEQTRAELAATETERDETQERLNARDAEIDALTKRHAEEIQNTETARAEIHAQLAELKVAYEASLEEAKALRAALEADLEQTRTDLAEITAERDEAYNELNARNAELKILNKRHDEQTLAHETAQAETNALLVELKAAREASFEEAKALRATFEADLEQARTDLTKMSTERNEAQERLNTRDEEISNLNARLDEMAQAHATAQTDVAEQLTKLKAAHAASLDEEKALRAALASEQERSAEWEPRLKLAQKRLVQAEAQVVLIKDLLFRDGSRNDAPNATGTGNRDADQ